jgi:hypothetical protein
MHPFSIILCRILRAPTYRADAFCGLTEIHRFQGGVCSFLKVVEGQAFCYDGRVGVSATEGVESLSSDSLCAKFATVVRMLDDREW